jgi:hypothetical protein
MDALGSLTLGADAAVFNSPTFPVRTRAAALPVGGEDTQLLASLYSGTLFLVATQLQTLGTLLLVRTDGEPGGGDGGAVPPTGDYPSSEDDDDRRGGGGERMPAVDVKVLLGRREDGALEAALARALASQPARSSRRAAPSAPPCAAQCSAVQRARVTASGSQPAASRAATTASRSG